MDQFDAQQHMSPPAHGEQDSYHKAIHKRTDVIYSAYDKLGRPLLVTVIQPPAQAQHLFFYECEDPAKACAATWPLDDEPSQDLAIVAGDVKFDSPSEEAPWSSAQLQLTTPYPMPCGVEVLVLADGVPAIRIPITGRSTQEGDQDASFAFFADINDFAPFAKALPDQNFPWLQVAVLMNAPAGAISLPTAAPPGLEPRRGEKITAVVDLDGDAVADVVFTAGGSEENACASTYRRHGANAWKSERERCAD